MVLDDEDEEEVSEEESGGQENKLKRIGSDKSPQAAFAAMETKFIVEEDS